VIKFPSLGRRHLVNVIVTTIIDLKIADIFGTLVGLLLIAILRMNWYGLEKQLLSEMFAMVMK
jgi:hypothetical protein